MAEITVEADEANVWQVHRPRRRYRVLFSDGTVADVETEADTGDVRRVLVDAIAPEASVAGIAEVERST
jgi:hypothetical protein